jgi:hypothetical protein
LGWYHHRHLPYQDNPGIKENAAGTLEKMWKNKMKRYNNNIKHKNLSTVNYLDLPEATKQHMRDQILMSEANNGTSVVSLVTTPITLLSSAAGCG